MPDTPHDVSSSKGNIVIFHEWLLAAGGAERLVVEEYRYLTKMGYRTTLLSFQAAPRALFGLAVDEVEVIPRRGVLDGIIRLRRRLAELNPDVIIVASGLKDMYLATCGRRVPYILHQHEAPYKGMVYHRQVLLPLLRHGAVRRIRETAYGYRAAPLLFRAKSAIEALTLEVQSILDYFALRGAFAVTVLSRRAAREVSLLYGREALSIRGCLSDDILSHQPKESLKERLELKDRRLFLSISRLDALKRLDVIIRAFALIAHRFEDIVLIIGGTGPEEKRLKHLSEDLGLAERIVFLGFVPTEELWDAMATCDVFVCADWTDFDIAPYEALALGRRVVWSSEMETDQGLERMGAIFAVEPSVKGLAEGMTRALLSPEVSRCDLVDFLQRYTWNNYFRQVLEVMSGCLNTKDASRGKLDAAPAGS
jgi:glycosyltransferase involved in cell wall biosynthesis